MLLAFQRDRCVVSFESEKHIFMNYCLRVHKKKSIQIGPPAEQTAYLIWMLRYWDFSG